MCQSCLIESENGTRGIATFAGILPGALAAFGVTCTLTTDVSHVQESSRTVADVGVAVGSGESIAIDEGATTHSRGVRSAAV